MRAFKASQTSWRTSSRCKYLPHPDLESEQVQVDRALACLEAMRAVTARLIEGEFGGTEVDSAIVREELEARLRSLSEQHGPLTFGRIDEEDGPRHYIGRRHVKDRNDEPVVVDWRAPVAAPFYRATIRDPLGLRRRRRFVFDDRRLLDIFEEDFADPDSVAAGHGGVPDPLLAELGRARSGDMQDIVATIQAEQDEIIRWPATSLVVLQGGPGTGKTAVGLHRAAFLLYEHRIELERDGVLVVGPNATFLEYISGVLPSLGETSVRQTTIEELFGRRLPVTVADDDEVATVKHDLRMAEVIRRACTNKISRATEDLTFDVLSRTLSISKERVNDALEKSLAGTGTLALGRELFTERLQRLAFRLFARDHDPSIDEAMFLSELRAGKTFGTARNRVWPTINPPQVVKDVLSGGPTLRNAARAVLDEHEIELLEQARRRRSNKGPWSRADLPLLDEATTRVSGPAFVYGHVIVDEAQDLAPMELRMLGRRSTTGSMTVLGDLAQATGLSAQRTWAEVIMALGVTAEPKTFELTVGYRVPKPIMELANRLLPTVAIEVSATESIRTEGDKPRLLRVDDDEVFTSAWNEAAVLAERWVTVAVIAPESLQEVARERFTSFDPDGDRWRSEHLHSGITLLTPPLAKGLEFDAVVVVEPAGIVAEELHGHRMLYIALTRAVQDLVIVHARDLPAELASQLTA
jgi:DNA helicase IV